MPHQHREQIKGFQRPVALAQQLVSVADRPQDSHRANLHRAVRAFDVRGVADDGQPRHGQHEQEQKRGEGRAPQAGKLGPRFRGQPEQPEAQNNRGPQREQGGQWYQANSKVENGNGREGRNNGKLQRIKGGNADGHAIEDAQRGARLATAGRGP